MAKPSIADLKLWVGDLFTKDDWDFNFTKIVGWLSNGESDIVINSLKVSNGLDLDGSNISNLAPATTGSQAVTYDQAQTLLNRTSYFTPFTIASGKVNNGGNAAYLQKDSDTQVTILAGNVNPDLVVIQSDGTVESVTSNVTLTVSVSDGTYYIVKEKGQNPTITSGKINIGKAYPTTQSAGDYFLNTSVEPLAGFKYDAQSGWVSTEFCLLGSVIVSSGVATVNTKGYNIFEFYNSPLPTGFFAWSHHIPTGFLICDGAAISRTTYADLFNKIGTTFGSGNGSTTFNLPNLINRYIKGNTTAGTVSNAYSANTGGGSANHTHTYLVPTGNSFPTETGGAGAAHTHSYTVGVDSLTMIPIIKY